MMANCSKNLGRQSTFAPTSSSRTGLWGTCVGNNAPIAGRSTPGKRPRRKRAAAIAAPECPAETTALACLRLTKFIATAIEELGLRRKPSSGSSSISMMPSEGTISRRSLSL